MGAANSPDSPHPSDDSGPDDAGQTQHEAPPMQDQLYLQSTTTIDRIPQHSLSLPEKLARLKAAEQHYYAIRMKMYGADLIDDIRAWVTELRDAKAEVEYWRDSAGGHASGSGSHGGS